MEDSTTICNAGLFSFVKSSGALAWQTITPNFIEFRDIMKINMDTFNYIYACGSSGASAST